MGLIFTINDDLNDELLIQFWKFQKHKSLFNQIFDIYRLVSNEIFPAINK
jgi:hypothetical protein